MGTETAQHNEAAERLLVEAADTLRMNLNDFSLHGREGEAERAWIQQSIDDLIGAASRATVERIRAALGPREYPISGASWDAFRAILDAEAA